MTTSFLFLSFLFSHSCSTQAKQKDQELSDLVKTVIATVNGVRTQGKAALREVDAVFKKLHEELEERKADVTEEVKRTASQKEKELLFQKDDVEFVVSGLRHVLEVGEITLREGGAREILWSARCRSR